MEELLIVIFLLIGPILDVLAFYNIPVNIIIRTIYLLGILFLMIKNKKNIKMLLLLLIFSIIYFLYQFFNLDYSLLNSISDLLKFLYLPISILFFKDFNFKKYDKRKILSIVLFTYISIFILSYLLKIGANAYLETDGKSGFKGLFSSINEFSAIIVGLIPLVINYLDSKKNYILICLLLIGSIICSLLLGTKILLGGIIISIIYLVYLERKKLFNNKKRTTIVTLFLVIITISSIFIFTKTRTYQNMRIQQSFFKANKVLSYEYLNRVVFNDRLTFLENNFNYFKERDITNKLLGIGFNNNDVKMVEIDICDILFRYGIIGFFIFILNLIKVPLNKINNHEKISFILLIIISLTSGHVLIYPNVCIYLGLLFSKNMLEYK